MSDSPEALKKRTKQFALRIIRMVESLPKSQTSDVIGKQVLHSRTSVGANYRAACRARSDAEFRSKMGIVEEEFDETTFWIELLIEAGIVRHKRLEPLLNESNELTAIAVASIRTSKLRKR